MSWYAVHSGARSSVILTYSYIDIQWSVVCLPCLFPVEICDSLAVTVCSAPCWEISLRCGDTQLPPWHTAAVEVCGTNWKQPTGRRRGASCVWPSSAARFSPSSFCSSWLVGWQQRGQTMDPSVWATTSILLRQSWQRTCLQTNVLFAAKIVSKHMEHSCEASCLFSCVSAIFLF